MRRSVLVMLGSLGLAAACRNDRSVGVEPLPRITSLVIASNPHNTLSGIVSVTVTAADSARVVYRAPGEAAAATPYSAVRGGALRLATLGLRPNTMYSNVVEAKGPGGAVASLPLMLRTGDLPQTLQGVSLELTGTGSPGYVVTEVTVDTDAFVVAFDSAGRVGWYRRFAAAPGEFAMETKQHPGGHFTVFVGATYGWQPTYGRYLEFTPAGEIVRAYTATSPLFTDPHELQLSYASGSADPVHLIGYDLRPEDLTALGGRANQPVAGHTILRLSASGAVEFRWSAWDHFSLTDWIFVPSNLAQLSSIDFDHPNSLAIDRDGNYVVSFASLGEITKIDAVTGQVLWRLGGRHNQFAIVGDPLGGFGFQHDVRVLENGDLLFYDNGLLHSPPQSRAVQYRLDTSAMTATLVWEYRHDPPLFTPFVGSVERYRNGNTLVGFASAALITEVTGDGQVVWEGRLTVNGQPVSFFYRARRLRSLYEYVEP
jgi:arylsulfotransferase ASST